MDYNLTITQAEESKIFLGVLFFLYIIAGEQIFKKSKGIACLLEEHPILKVFVVFSAAFVSTKDIKVSAILTTVYVLIFELLFDPESKFSILPASCKIKPEDKKKAKAQKK